MTYKKIIENSFTVLTDVFEQMLVHIESDLLLDFYTSFNNYDKKPKVINYELAKTYMLKNNKNYSLGLRAILDNLDFIFIEKQSYVSDIFIYEDCTLFIMQEYGTFTCLICNKKKDEVMLAFKVEVIRGEHYLSVLFNENNKIYEMDFDFINFVAYSIILAQTPQLKAKKVYKLKAPKKQPELL